MSVMVNISVIIPVYNVAAYITECLESILYQTMTDNVECILVDDCGPDNSIEIIENIKANYKGNVQINIIRHDKNKGSGGARNTGLKAARGEYVIFVDSDDYITNDCLESLWTLAKKYPKAEVIHGLAFTDNQKQNEDFHLCVTKHKFPEYSEDVNYIRRETLLNHFGIYPFNRLFKRSFLIENDIFFLENVILEDYPWTMDYARKLTAVGLCAKDTCFYRLHGSSVMGSINPKSMKSVVTISDYMLSNISLGDTFLIELYRIIEFMHIYEDKFGQSPLESMMYGKNKIFRRFYHLAYQKNNLLAKIQKPLLIKLLKCQLKREKCS